MLNIRPKKILVIRDGRLGDLVMITPVINNLSEKFPNSAIDVLIGESGKFIFDTNYKIREVYSYNRRGSLIDKLKLIQALRKKKYDLIVNLEVDSHYKILSYLINSKRIIGFSGKLDFILDDRVKWNSNNHTIINNLNVLGCLVENTKMLSSDTSLYLDSSALNGALNFLIKEGIDKSDGKKIVFIQVACGPYEKLRVWPKEFIATLADLLIENLDLVVILNSGPGEELFVRKVEKLMKYKPLVNCGNSIEITSALIQLSDIFIGPDTGTMHIANALRKPVIALFGPSNPNDTGPLSSFGNVVIIKKDFSCSPCLHRKDSKEKDKCLRQGFSDCMKDITVEEVYNAVIKFLGL